VDDDKTPTKRLNGIQKGRPMPNSQAVPHPQNKYKKRDLKALEKSELRHSVNHNSATLASNWSKELMASIKVTLYNNKTLKKMEADVGTMYDLLKQFAQKLLNTK
jgi:hypothetical protein